MKWRKTLTLRFHPPVTIMAMEDQVPVTETTMEEAAIMEGFVEVAMNVVTTDIGQVIRALGVTRALHRSARKLMILLGFPLDLVILTSLVTLVRRAADLIIVDRKGRLLRRFDCPRKRRRSCARLENALNAKSTDIWQGIVLPITPLSLLLQVNHLA